jgi:hypothetical protein
MREGKSRADRGRELGAVIARPQKKERRQGDAGGHRIHARKRMAVGKALILDQQHFLQALEEVVVVADILPPPQGDRRDLIGAGRAPEAKVDASGKQRFQHLEALHDGQRGVIGQHHAAGADAQTGCHGRNLPDHDLGRRARDVRQVVMLGDPIARVAQRIGVAREIEAVVQGLRGRCGRGHRRKIEDGKRRHGHLVVAGDIRRAARFRAQSGEVETSVPNPKFACTPSAVRERTSDSKGH